MSDPTPLLRSKHRMDVRLHAAIILLLSSAPLTLMLLGWSMGRWEFPNTVEVSLFALVMVVGSLVSLAILTSAKFRLACDFYASAVYSWDMKANPCDLLMLQVRRLRQDCLNSLPAAMGSISLHSWMEHEWDIICHKGKYFALLPARFDRDGETPVGFEACCVGQLVGEFWNGTSLLLLGNVHEARRELVRLFQNVQGTLNESRPTG